MAYALDEIIDRVIACAADAAAAYGIDQEEFDTTIGELMWQLLTDFRDQEVQKALREAQLEIPPGDRIRIAVLERELEQAQSRLRLVEHERDSAQQQAGDHSHYARPY